MSLKDAEIIVSAGRGFKKKEDLAILDDLTKVLNGAMGASRPLTSGSGLGSGGETSGSVRHYSQTQTLHRGGNLRSNTALDRHA